MNARDRIVVTGVGPVAPNGIGLHAFWSALVEGRSAIRPVTRIDVSRHNRKVGGEVQGFDPLRYMSSEVAASTGRTSQLAIAAGELALEDARFAHRPSSAYVAVGSTLGDMAEVETLDDQWLEGGAGTMQAEATARHNPAAFAIRIARALGLSGRAVSVHGACSSSNQAISMAADALRMGRASVALAGGSDGFSRLTYSGFARIGAMAPDLCRPFDKNRKGMLVAEGAGMVVLETLEAATRRGARIYGEVAGAAMTCDANHLASPPPDGAGLAYAMTAALEAAGVDPAAVDYIGAHGTGTVANDRSESRALYSVFGSRAARIPVNSIKSMIGHTMGAANVLQMIACLVSMRESMITPTINFETPDPACDLDCVPNRARAAHASRAIINGAGFGGNDSCVVLKKVG